MSKDSHIFKVDVSYKQKTGTWLDHDDFRFDGLVKKERYAESFYIVAYDEHLIPVLLRNYCHPEQEFKLDKVEDLGRPKYIVSVTC